MYHGRSVYDRHAYMLNEALEDGKSDGFRFDGKFAEYIAKTKYGDIKSLVTQMEIDYERSARFVERHDYTFERTISLFIVTIVVMSMLALFGLAVNLKSYFMNGSSPVPLFVTLLLIGLAAVGFFLVSRKWNHVVGEHYYTLGYLSVAQQHMREWIERMESQHVIPYDFCFETDYMSNSEWSLYESFKEVARKYQQKDSDVLDIDFFRKGVVREKLLFDALDDEVQEDVV